MDVVWANRHLLWLGLRYTFKLFALVFVISAAIGVLGGAALIYGNWPIKAVVRAYVDILRGIPLIVTIFPVVYGPVAYGINLSSVQSISFALSIFAGAHMSEIVRG